MMFDAIAVLVIFVLLGTGIGIVIGVRLEQMEQRKRITTTVINTLNDIYLSPEIKERISSLENGEIEINGNYRGGGE